MQKGLCPKPPLTYIELKLRQTSTNKKPSFCKSKYQVNRVAVWATKVFTQRRPQSQHFHQNLRWQRNETRCSFGILAIRSFNGPIAILRLTDPVKDCFLLKQSKMRFCTITSLKILEAPLLTNSHAMTSCWQIMKEIGDPPTPNHPLESMTTIR